MHGPPKYFLTLLEITAQLGRFAFVGLLAMLVHFLAASLMLNTLLSPHVANFAAFSCALPVSYGGHRNWTFQNSNRRDSSSMLRFLAAALAGFACNELLFAMLLNFTPLSPRLALAGVLVTIAFFTFLLCRCWVFHRNIS